MNFHRWGGNIFFNPVNYEEIIFLIFNCMFKRHKSFHSIFLRFVSLSKIFFHSSPTRNCCLFNPHTIFFSSNVVDIFSVDGVTQSLTYKKIYVVFVKIHERKKNRVKIWFFFIREDSMILRMQILIAQVRCFGDSFVANLQVYQIFANFLSLSWKRRNKNQQVS